MIATEPNAVFLAPAEYVDSDHPRVKELAERLVSGEPTPAAIAQRIFYAVRDIRYGAPDFDRLASFKASTLLAEGSVLRTESSSLRCALSGGGIARAAGLR
ncbi:hypothetical protein JQ628_28445 [Bradyrhizobium lablabi]|uniref:hypothetical protein n=1 Tax=Bradyrhizobium lablabi TaxID=722472 RepID=UPI001BA8CFDC|nr:hypothetical protein [Bradyrhizobium lablabi]MBR1125481.1 hypothetical protein [Bradyrhizobium lablabi]